MRAPSKKIRWGLALAFGAGLAMLSCGQHAPGFSDDEVAAGSGSRKDCCCREANVLMPYAGDGKEACPPGFAYHSPVDCPGGMNYPHGGCDFDWHDAGTPDDGGAPEFCCCAGAQTAPPVAVDGGMGCPASYQKLTLDLCPGGANYPNGMCGP